MPAPPEHGVGRSASARLPPPYSPSLERLLDQYSPPQVPPGPQESSTLLQQPQGALHAAYAAALPPKGARAGPGSFKKDGRQRSSSFNRDQGAPEAQVQQLLYMMCDGTPPYGVLVCLPVTLLQALQVLCQGY